jgi:hypothetical protein
VHSHLALRGWAVCGCDDLGGVLQRIGQVSRPTVAAISMSTRQRECIDSKEGILADVAHVLVDPRPKEVTQSWKPGTKREYHNSRRNMGLEVEIQKQIGSL